ACVPVAGSGFAVMLRAASDLPRPDVGEGAWVSSRADSDGGHDRLRSVSEAKRTHRNWSNAYRRFLERRAWVQVDQGLPMAKVIEQYRTEERIGISDECVKRCGIHEPTSAMRRQLTRQSKNVVCTLDGRREKHNAEARPFPFFAGRKPLGQNTGLISM